MNSPTQDETLIIEYLRQFPRTFISNSEVCKRADSRKRFEQDPDWARPVLRRMTNDGWLTANEFGQFKLIDEALGDQKCSKADRVKRMSDALSVHILSMNPEDDEKPFTVLIKEVAQSAWTNSEGKRAKVEE